ncbi:hypothetical protein OSCT_0543 [Oscillochloris trichoides DG-6]|uniref:Yip1 domain-containing protein n=1 Tax=Oscillochloris trichoides DG-6 TaxID=765420 RepID=E1IB42_9CHLR|nr:hypothetical protein OSCT_0543 [Oscillochloris trichoides DG-6]
MINQSRDIMTNPSVETFERYERHGNMTNAAIYVGIAAIISGLLGWLASLILPRSSDSPGFFGIAIGIVIGFFIFTGMVFYIGRNIAEGTGTWDEVAYTFSLFAAPLAIVGGLLNFVVAFLRLIPVLGSLFWLLGGLVSLLILLVQAYFAYIAVQSSMNIRDQGRAITTLGLAVVGAFIVQFVITMLIL